MSVRSKEDVVQEFRVQSIQDAAMRVIERRGMAAATMQEIAAEAGVAKGTLYLYFRDRDELVEKTFERAMGALHARIDAALQSASSFEQSLRAMLTAEIEFFRDHREFFRLYMSLRLPQGNAQQQRRQKRTCQPQYRSRIEQFAKLLDAAMNRGEIRRLDPNRLALFIVEASNAIIIERVLEEAPPPEEQDVELIASTIFNGIRSSH